MRHATIIDRRLAGKNKSHRQPRALPRAAPRSRSARRSQRAVDGRGIRDIERGEDRSRIPKQATSPSRVFRHGARAARARSCTRATRNTCAATASSGRKGGGGSGARQGAASDRRGRGRLRLHADPGRVHADLLRRPGAAPPRPDLARRRRRVEEPRAGFTATARRATCTSCARCAARSAGASRCGRPTRGEMRRARSAARRAEAQRPRRCRRAAS